ncbi:hypothetical protein B1M_44919 [Burkholderia sp. TJI49]|nr:hypothetical protein B1M_44919 [Burkholderia sp. TJI49]
MVAHRARRLYDDGYSNDRRAPRGAAADGPAMIAVDRACMGPQQALKRQLRSTASAWDRSKR